MPTPLSHWIVFHAGLLLLLGFELLFSRWGLRRLEGDARARRQHRNAVWATVLWISAALLLAVYFLRTSGASAATQFLAGYSIEEALSIDNLFVFLLLFRVFQIQPTWQPRVLFWGVLGAIVLRGTFIAAGIGLLTRFHWVDYLFAVVLLFAGVRLLIPEKKDAEPDCPPDRRSDHPPDRRPGWVRWISLIHPVSPRQDTFFVREDGKRMVTMLFLALLAIESADIVFALDSIPAVLSITRSPFIAYTSNILAVMGLRSLFFLLAAALKRLRFLHFGLAAVLIFAAAKMLIADWYAMGPLLSLGVILGILAVTVTASLWMPQRRP